MTWLYCFSFVGWVLACFAFVYAKRASARAEEAISGLVVLEHQWQKFIVRWDNVPRWTVSDK